MRWTRGRRWQSLVGDRRAVDAALVLACLSLTALAVKGHWQTLRDLDERITAHLTSST